MPEQTINVEFPITRGRMTARRACEINSNQFYARGWWHGFFQLEGGPCALVENALGQVSVLDMRHYSIGFVDSLVAEPPRGDDVVETAKRACEKINAHDFKRIAGALGLEVSEDTTIDQMVDKIKSLRTAAGI
jgi:hypothetical protein